MLGEIGPKQGAAPKTSFGLLWLRGKCRAHPKFSWKTLTCLQIFPNDLLRGSETYCLSRGTTSSLSHTLHSFTPHSTVNQSDNKHFSLATCGCQGVVNRQSLGLSIKLNRHISSRYKYISVIYYKYQNFNCLIKDFMKSKFQVVCLSFCKGIFSDFMRV